MIFGLWGGSEVRELQLIWKVVCVSLSAPVVSGSVRVPHKVRCSRLGFFDVI